MTAAWYAVIGIGAVDVAVLVVLIGASVVTAVRRVVGRAQRDE